MNIHVIDTGFFKLDGGAMFGVVPRTLWQKLEEPDENNLCTWAMRCLLIETDDKRRILIDTGLGNKQSAKFFGHYHPHGEASLLGSLKAKGFVPEDITDVLLTHLHFDHVGGALYYDEAKRLRPTFPNARYWSNEAHFNWAEKPNSREKASFLVENFIPLREEGILHFVESLPHSELLDWLPGIKLGFAYGHTEAMMIPHIEYKGKTLVYCADLLPSPSHIPLPYVMGYDVRPLQTLEEKAAFLQRAEEQDYLLFFEHAPKIEACGLARDSRGRIVANEQGLFSDFF